MTAPRDPIGRPALVLTLAVVLWGFAIAGVTAFLREEGRRVRQARVVAGVEGRR